MERIYPAYANKVKLNTSWAKDNPDNFAENLNTTYWKLRQSKSKDLQRLKHLPVRIYGGGDYTLDHYNFLSKLTFKFFMISKSLTRQDFIDEIPKLLALPNLTRIVLSFDNENIKNYENVKHLYKTDKIQFSFTGSILDWNLQTEFNSRAFGVFFNTSDKKADKLLARNIRQTCPTESNKLPLKHACSICNKCWRSSVTRDGI
jgi:hypothetical protein